MNKDNWLIDTVLQWNPDEINGWPEVTCNDNEFIAGKLADGEWSETEGRAVLPSRVWNEYLKWSQHTQTGTVYTEDEEYVYIMLDTPMNSEYFSVAYPKTSLSLANVRGPLGNVTKTRLQNVRLVCDNEITKLEGGK